MEMTGKRLKEGITAFFFQNKIKRRHTRIFFGSHYYLYLHLPICSTKRHAQCEHGLQGSNCMYYEYNHPYNGQTNKRFFFILYNPDIEKNDRPDTAYHAGPRSNGGLNGFSGEVEAG